MWKPHGEVRWYIRPAMEHYIFHTAYIPKTRAERISDTVEFFPKQFNIPKIFSMYATIHDALDLIHALHNPALTIPLVTLENSHKESLISPADIFGKSTSPVVPPGLPFRGKYQEKL